MKTITEQPKLNLDQLRYENDGRIESPPTYEEATSASQISHQPTQEPQPTQSRQSRSAGCPKGTCDSDCLCVHVTKNTAIGSAICVVIVASLPLETALAFCDCCGLDCSVFCCSERDSGPSNYCVSCCQAACHA